MPDLPVPGRDIAEFTTSAGLTVDQSAESWSGPTLIVGDALTHRLGDHHLAARTATEEDPDLSLWVSDDAGPSGYEWGCVECHGDDPGGREFYRSAATAAAWMHGREAHANARPHAAVADALAHLDGTVPAAVGLLTGMSRAEMDEHGGFDEVTR